MKRIICFILTLSLLLLSVGCGSQPNSGGSTLWPSYLTPENIVSDWSEGLPEGFTLRVGSFNIMGARGVEGDIASLAEEILALGLDIVGIQEVDEGTARSGGVYITKELAEACGFKYYKHTAAMDYDGGTYGTSIISRYRIEDCSDIFLTTGGSQEPRAVGYARINIKGFDVDFYNTHLSYESTRTRERQLKDLSYAIFSGSNTVLTGDLNVASASELEVFADDYNIVNNGTMSTFPEKGYAVDDIILDKSWTVVECGVEDVEGKSDHNLIWAELAYAGDEDSGEQAPEDSEQGEDGGI